MRTRKEQLQEDYIIEKEQQMCDTVREQELEELFRFHGKIMELAFKVLDIVRIECSCHTRGAAEMAIRRINAMIAERRGYEQKD